MIIRIHHVVHSNRLSQMHRREIRDDFIRIHIRRRPGAALNDINSKCIVILIARDQRITRSRNSLMRFIAKQPKSGVRHRARLLRQRERLDELGIFANLHPSDVVVFHRPRRSDAVKRVSRNRHRSKQITLDARRRARRRAGAARARHRSKRRRRRWMRSHSL